jgi:hypothetical protein
VETEELLQERQKMFLCHLSAVVLLTGDVVRMLPLVPSVALIDLRVRGMEQELLQEDLRGPLLDRHDRTSDKGLRAVGSGIFAAMIKSLIALFL